MTPEAKYQSEGKTVFLEVAPETKSCTVFHHKLAYKFVKLNMMTKA